MTGNVLRNGLIAASAMNIGGAILFSKGFTNKAINQADPVVMSNFGLIMIKWGQRSRINKMTSLGRVPAL